MSSCSVLLDTHIKHLHSKPVSGSVAKRFSAQAWVGLTEQPTMKTNSTANSRHNKYDQGLELALDVLQYNGGLPCLHRWNGELPCLHRKKDRMGNSQACIERRGKSHACIHSMGLPHSIYASMGLPHSIYASMGVLHSQGLELALEFLQCYDWLPAN